MNRSKQTPLAARIRARRESMELSQDAAADLCGVDRQVYCRIEQGRSNGSLESIPGIAKGLRIPLEELIKLRRAFLERSS